MTATTTSTPVLYVGGWGRSGSTLLDLILGQVPGFVSVGELRDVWLRGWVENRRCGCSEPFRACPFWDEVGRTAFGPRGWAGQDPEELARLRLQVDRPWYAPALAWDTATAGYRRRLERFAATQGRLYRAVASVSGAHTIVDSSKIATYALLLRRIPELDLRVVHLVRDSRGVAHSWSKHVRRDDATSSAPRCGAGAGHTDEMLRYGTVAASGRYLLYNAMTAALGRGAVPYLRIRYEDLVADPEPTVRRVLAHAGTPDADLAHLRGRDVRRRTSHTVDGNPIRLDRGPLRIRADEAWRTALAPGRQRVVTALTYPLLRRYGYLQEPA